MSENQELDLSKVIKSLQSDNKALVAENKLKARDIENLAAGIKTADRLLGIVERSGYGADFMAGQIALVRGLLAELISDANQAEIPF